MDDANEKNLPSIRGMNISPPRMDSPSDGNRLADLGIGARPGALDEPSTRSPRNWSAAGIGVLAALLHLSLAHEILGDVGVVFLQAPFKHQRMQEIHPCRTFAHILHNIGFSNVAELTTMTGAWRQLFEHVRPDLIVFDHSPTALLAASGWQRGRC